MQIKVQSIHAEAPSEDRACGVGAGGRCKCSALIQHFRRTLNAEYPPACVPIL